MNLYILFYNNKHLLSEFIYIFLFSSFLFSILILLVKNIKVLEKNNIQKIHSGKSIRLGGVVFVLMFLLIGTIKYYSINNFIIVTTLFAAPLIFVTLLEDLYQNISPIIRLIAIFFSSIFLCSFGMDSLPIIDIPVVDKFINLPLINILFYAICLTAFINGVNFIDGTNGLAGFSLLASIFSLLFLSLIFNDIEVSILIIYIIAILFSFLMFNYPFGKIFLGDLGAYFLGWTMGSLTIFFMSRNSEVLNWCALIILSYPTTEVVFSFFRKIIAGQKPTSPDRNHLHLKLFFTLNKKIDNKIAANSLVVPFLALIWLTPLVLIPWIYSNKILIMLSVFLQIIIYFSFYAVIPKEKK